MDDYKKGQLDLIEDIKKKVLDLESTTDTKNCMFDVIALLKSIKPVKR